MKEPASLRWFWTHWKQTGCRHHLSAQRCVFISPASTLGLALLHRTQSPTTKSPALLCTWAQGNQQLPMALIHLCCTSFLGPWTMRFGVMTVVDERRRRSPSTDLALQRSSSISVPVPAHTGTPGSRGPSEDGADASPCLPVPQGDCVCSRGTVLGLPPPPLSPESGVLALGFVVGSFCVCGGDGRWYRYGSWWWMSVLCEV